MESIEAINETSFTIKCDGITAQFLDWHWFISNHKQFALFCWKNTPIWWNLTATIEFKLFEKDGIEKLSKIFDATYNQSCFSCHLTDILPDNMSLRDYCERNNLTYRCAVEVKSSATFPFSFHDFKIADNFNPTVINVGGEKLFVNKMMLSNYSPVFNAMFKTSNAVSIKDVETDKFEMLLRVIYGFEDVDSMLIAEYQELADRFGLQLVDAKCDRLIDKNRKISKEVKLIHDFEKTDGFNDTLLDVSGKNIYINKMMLTKYSKRFKNVFKVKKCAIRDVEYNHFETFLLVAYGFEEVADNNVEALLELTNRFDHTLIKFKCERFLLVISTKRAVDKLALADKYSLETLKKTVLQRLKQSDVKAIGTSCPDLSDDMMKQLLCLAAGLVI